MYVSAPDHAACRQPACITGAAGSPLPMSVVTASEPSSGCWMRDVSVAIDTVSAAGPLCWSFARSVSSKVAVFPPGRTTSPEAGSRTTASSPTAATCRSPVFASSGASRTSGSSQVPSSATA
jgi:hypothetical protein